jgi:hypothetical protein
MEILILSKTHKGKAACVGGLVLQTNLLIRLLNLGNWDQYADTELQIGDVWDIQFTNRPDIVPPHIEDAIIKNKKFVKKQDNLSKFLQSRKLNIYKGSPSNIFNGLLRWTGNGHGYIADKEKLPENSVGFWISDEDLHFQDKYYTYHSSNRSAPKKAISYVGFLEPIAIITSGTLIRLSLARWWKPEDSEIEERCYLQLSGWYLD